MNCTLILTYWTLHRLRSDELPAIAAEWLSEGLDSPALRELAGTPSPEMSVVGPLFERAMEQLRLTVPQKEEALAFLGRYYAQQIIDGTLTPYDGARKIWWQVSNELDEPSQLLRSFVGAASEIEDLPERSLQDGYDRRKYAGELEAMIVASARELLEERPTQPPVPMPGKVPSFQSPSASRHGTPESFAKNLVSETPSLPRDFWRRIPWIAFTVATVGYVGYVGSIFISGVAMGLGDDSHREVHLLVRGAAGLLWFIGVVLAALSLVVYLRRKTEEMKIPLIFASIPTVLFPLLGHLRRLIPS